MTKHKKPSKEATQAIKYPGVAEDIADEEKVDKRLVKQATKELNNNPQNNGKLI